MENRTVMDSHYLGLRYDREWVLVDDDGNYLNQKKILRLCLIRPIIDLKNEIIRIEAPQMEPLIISLSTCPTKMKDLNICGDR